jgi:hypothetical protein
VGTVAALSVNQKLRRDGPVARSIKFIPVRDGTGRTKVSFRLTDDDTVEVAIVDADGQLVRVLAPPTELEGDDAKHHYFWDRRTEDGEPAEPGRYRLRLTLTGADRVATSGERLSIKSREPG